MESIATACGDRKRASSSSDRVNENAFKALLDIEITMPHIDVFIGLIYDALEFDTSNKREALAAQGKLYTLMRSIEQDVRGINNVVDGQLRPALCGVH